MKKNTHINMFNKIHGVEKIKKKNYEPKQSLGEKKKKVKPVLTPRISKN